MGKKTHSNYEFLSQRTAASREIETTIETIVQNLYRYIAGPKTD